jgi:hypothetical protein
MRSDRRSHSNYNVVCSQAQVTSVDQREARQIPIEIQQRAVDLDEKMFGVAAPMVGPWQWQLNELGGVKPLALLRPVRETRVRTLAAPGPAGGGGYGRSGQARDTSSPTA